jgi:hypothetical protein
MSLNIPLQPYGANFAKLQWPIVIIHVVRQNSNVTQRTSIGLLTARYPKHWGVRNASRIDQTNAEWEFQLPYFCLVHYVISDSLIAMDWQYK